MAKKMHGKHTHSVKPKMQKHEAGKGGNLNLPHPKSAIHVAPSKDKMSHNVGGSDHMMGPKGAEGHQDLMESGGAAKGVKKVREKY